MPHGQRRELHCSRTVRSRQQVGDGRAGRLGHQIEVQLAIEDAGIARPSDRPLHGCRIGTAQRNPALVKAVAVGIGDHQPAAHRAAQPLPGRILERHLAAGTVERGGEAGDRAE